MLITQQGDGEWLSAWSLFSRSFQDRTVWHFWGGVIAYGELFSRNLTLKLKTYKLLRVKKVVWLFCT